MKKIESWLDTNVIIYYLRYNKDYSPAARQLIDSAKAGNVTLKVSPVVINECVFVLQGKQFRLKKEMIEKVLTSFINIPGVESEEKQVIEEALTNYKRKGIDFTDAYIAAHAKAVTPNHVITVNIRDFRDLGVFVQTPMDVKNESP